MKFFQLCLLSFGFICTSLAQDFVASIATQDAINCDFSTITTGTFYRAGVCIPTPDGQSVVASCFQNTATIRSFSDAFCQNQLDRQDSVAGQCVSGAALFCGVPDLPSGSFQNAYSDSNCNDITISLYTISECTPGECTDDGSVSADLTCGNSPPSSASTLVVSYLLAGFISLFFCLV